MSVPQFTTITIANDSLRKIWMWNWEQTVSSYFLCAFVAGSIGAVITCPFDVIKTRLQTQKVLKENNFVQMASSSSGNASVSQHVKYFGIWSTMAQILQEEGLMGFYKGALPRVFSIAPSAAVSWTAYDLLKKTTGPFFKKTRLNCL
jgi:hypothetical protein